MLDEIDEAEVDEVVRDDDIDVLDNDTTEVNEVIIAVLLVVDEVDDELVVLDAVD